MTALTYTGANTWPVRHRVFEPGETAVFDMDDPADAALYHKCRVLPFFAEAEPPKRRGRPRRAQDKA